MLIPDPRRRLLAGGLDHRRAAARVEGRASRRGRRHVRQHDRRGQGRDRLLLHLGQRRRGGASTSFASTARTPRSCSAPTCSSAPTSRRRSGARCTCGTASATCTPGSGPSDITAVRAAHPGADFLIHPECGCSTSVMEYVAAGDVDAEGVHMLSTGGMLGYAREHAGAGGTAIVATETGMLHPLRQAAPGRRVHRRQRGRPLPLHEDDHAAQAPRRAARRRARGQGPAAIADRARVPIERMVAISLTRGRGRADPFPAPRSRGRPAASRACARTPPACSSGRRPGAHLEGVPQRAAW